MELSRLKDVTVDVKQLSESISATDRHLQALIATLNDRHKDDSKRFETLETTMDNVLKSIAALESGSRLSHQSSSFQVRNVKLDFPRFDGSDVLQWIFKAEQFFDYYKTPDEQRLLIASVHMDKDVVPWFQMQSRTNPFHTWIALTRALELEFGPSPYECPRSDLFKLTQDGSVHDYYVKFTALANRVQGVTGEALLDCFVGDLQQDIRRDVLAQAPTTLMRCVSLAKLYEEKYGHKSHTSYKFHPKPQTQATNISQASQSLKSSTLPPLLPKPTSTHPSKNFTVKKMSPAEMQLRREKGLCFTCDEKFTPSHRCPNKQYLWLQLEEEHDVTDQPNSSVEDAVDEIPPVCEPHLSFNALKGSAGIGTMRFQGILNGLPIQILLDSGSSDNFLQPRIANYLNLPIEPIHNFKCLGRQW